jgi:hypothetical protein
MYIIIIVTWIKIEEYTISSTLASVYTSIASKNIKEKRDT